MNKLTASIAVVLLCAGMTAAAFADTITMWTMEEQPDRMARQGKIAADFKARTGHTVRVVAVTEKEIATRATAAFAAGELPDVLNHTVQHLLPFAEAGILDSAAATEVVEDLGVGSFASGPVNMAQSDGEIVSVPTDGWTQLVVYRADLFAVAGLNPPRTFADIEAAIAELHNPPSLYGFVAATKIDETYMMQLLEHISLAAGYSPVNAAGRRRCWMSWAACATARRSPSTTTQPAKRWRATPVLSPCSPAPATRPARRMPMCGT